MSNPEKRFWTLMVAIPLVMACFGAHAAPPAEYEVKAAFIHNIAKYVEWPSASSSSHIARLCVLGQNPFGDALQALQGRQIGGRSWEIVLVGPSAGLKDCRVLFIAASERRNLDRILKDIGNNPVLTIGDSDGYAEHGVMVNFYLDNNRVHFEINQDAAVRAKLTIGSQLLKLARIISPSGGAQ